MVIKYYLSKAPARLENLLVKIYEAENPNPGAEVYTETIVEKDALGVPTPGGGHNIVNTVIANGLDRVVHVVKLYGATSGELIHNYNVEPKEDVVVIFDPIKFKIGDGGSETPVAGTNSCTNAALAGLTTNEFLIFRNNYGILFETIHYTFNTVDGTWQLVDADIFNDEEEFAILKLPKPVTTNVNDSVVGKWFGGFVDVSVNTNYSNAHLRKLIRFSGSAEYTFLVTDNVPVGYGFVFNHFGSAGTAKVNFNNGTLLWGGSPKSTIDIPRYSQACFVWDGTNWNAAYFVSSDFANSPAMPAGTIVGGGVYNIGDVGGGDPQWEVTHNLNVPGDYLVLLSIKSNNAATYARNNKIGSTWWHHATNKANKFWFSLQEISPEVQDLSVAWTIQKL